MPKLASLVPKSEMFKIAKEYLDQIGCPAYDDVELRQFLEYRYGSRLRSSSVREKKNVPLSILHMWAKQFQEDKYGRFE